MSKTSSARKTQMIELLDKILSWAEARNLPKGATAVSQSLKMTTEFHEILQAEANEDLAEIIDGIGDSVVVAVIVSQQMGVYTSFREFVGERAETIHTMGDTVPLMAEAHELFRAAGHLGLASDAVLKQRPETFLKEIIGFVNRLALVAEHNSATLAQCVRRAYEEIKDRKGVMFNGSFVKSDDPAYPAAVAALAAS